VGTGSLPAGKVGGVAAAAAIQSGSPNPTGVWYGSGEMQAGCTGWQLAKGNHLQKQQLQEVGTLQVCIAAAQPRVRLPIKECSKHMGHKMYLHIIR
jgi:hypothetical protein